MIRHLRERLGYVIRHKQCYATGPTMRRGGGDRLGEIPFGGHIVDRVVQEHRIEHAPEAQIAHITLDVLALGVQISTQLKHLVR